MSEAVYRQTFDRIEELFQADKKVSKINVELLGGELTMMPLEFWKRNLPWTLERMATWDGLYDCEAALIWCTNLIFRDEGYIGLLNEMGERFGKGLDLFVPWEPDTNRFKKDFKLLPRYLRTLAAITGIKRKTLCVTMSRAVIEQGPQFLVDTFLPHGITDITCDMLYPSGSGKSYFQRTCTYGHVSEYLLELHSLLPESVELSPLVEMEAACKTLTHYHYPGNDTYDIEVEPNGEVTFNSSYTGAESILGSEQLLISDTDFAAKVVFNNSPELRLRHSMPYEACHTCEFAVVCSGGWGWHKQLSTELSGLISDGDCAGLKRVWEYAKGRAGIRQADRSSYLDMVGQRQRRGKYTAKRLGNPGAQAQRLSESEYMSDYDAFLSQFERPRLVSMVDGPLHGKDWVERLFFYDAIGSQVEPDAAWYSRAVAQGGEELFRHILYRNYHFLHFDPIEVASKVEAHREWKLSRDLALALSELENGGTGARTMREGRHDELSEFAFLVHTAQTAKTSHANEPADLTHSIDQSMQC